ncbi:cystatin-like protein [Drosophila virilis]|uniref:Cystatin domain-containing protein n=1 Tax=Drosophila virilis TaxID=7244 RepID=B4LVV5_DROVI|nr:cystatin-like protein [Drosophila virilis]EDW67560.1 uncharacterized protein Dvir_GJ23017 [Drosophila virilis]
MFGSKLIYLTILALVCVLVASDESPPIVGGHKELSGEELEKAVANLHATLAKLSTGDGPNYAATKVLKVTTQVVAGTLDTYTVELTSDNVAKQCTVKIWSQPWLKENGTNVKIECQGDDAKVDRTW